MNSLLFILTRTTKNQLLELRRKPGKLVLYLGAIAVLAVVMISSNIPVGEADEYSDILWVKGIAFIVFMFSVVTCIVQGLSKGDAIFQMEDVNFLFVSPLNPRSILVYGMSRMVKTAIVTSIFIFFQSTWLRATYGVGLSGMLIIYAAFVLITAVTPVLAVAIYSLTNGRPERKRLVKILAVVMLLPMAAAAAWHLQASGWDFSEGMLALLRSNVSSFTPIAGWASAGVVSFLTGHYVAGALFFGLLALFGVALVVVIYSSNQDYYEDVLVATEKAFDKLRSLAEGQINLEAVSDKRVRVKATGIGGRGASTLFYRHIREAFRASRFGLWGVSTPILTIGAAGFAFFMSRSPGEADNTILTLLIIVMFAQVTLVGLGRGLKDLYSHYVYMIPESPLKKIIWSNLEIVFKTAMQNVLIFVAAGFITGAGTLVVAGAIVASTMFSFVVISVNYFFMRFTGTRLKGGIFLIVYFLAIIVVMQPGMVVAIILGTSIEGWGLLAGLMALTAWELVVGVVGFAMSKGILHSCDMATMSQYGK